MKPQTLVTVSQLIADSLQIHDCIPHLLNNTKDRSTSIMFTWRVLCERELYHLNSHRGIRVKILQDEFGGLPDFEILENDLGDPLHLCGCGVEHQPPMWSIKLRP